MSIRCVLSSVAVALLVSACGSEPIPSPTDNDDGLALEPVAGNQQTGIAGRALADSVVVRAVSRSGAPVAGVPVSWSATGGTVSSATTATDADGFARVQWRAGPGSGSLAAAAVGAPSVTFTSTGRPSGPCVLAPAATTQRFSLGPTDFTLSLRATPGMAAYATCKHALLGLMRSTCQDLAGRGIHTALICPGFTDTEMLREFAGPVLDQVRARCTQGRLIEPREIAEVIHFAAGNAVVNGATLGADLGLVEL